MKKTVLYGDRTNVSLSQNLARELHLPLFYPEIHVFPDGEKRIRVVEEVVGLEIFILKSFSTPVDGNILEFLFTIDALKRAGGKSVTAIIPYLAYQRADHVFRSGEAVPLSVIVSLIEKAGVNSCVLLEPHSIKIPELFTIPVTHVSAIPIFAEKISSMFQNLSQVSVVSPDMGGIRRVKQLADLLPGVTWAAVNKDRDLVSGNINATHHIGDISPICVIVDDICSTGKTIAQAADYLSRQGAREVYCFCTHPVFSGDVTAILQSANLKMICITDSLYVSPEKQFDTLETISVASLLANHINRK